MRDKEERRVSLSLAALWGLVLREGEWVGAIDLAEELALPWRPIAFTLRRLVAKGFVEEQLITVRGTSRTKEETRRYRLGAPAQRHPFEPVRHPVAPGVARRVVGRSGLG